MSAGRGLRAAAVGGGLALCVVFTASHSTMLNLARDARGSLPFAPSAIVLLQEALKAAACAVLLLLSGLRRARGGKEADEAPARLWWPQRDALYAIPAVCYAVNNNLAVVLQDEMDPATFQVRARGRCWRKERGWGEVVGRPMRC